MLATSYRLRPGRHWPPGCCVAPHSLLAVASVDIVILGKGRILDCQSLIHKDVLAMKPSRDVLKVALTRVGAEHKGRGACHLRVRSVYSPLPSGLCLSPSFQG